MKFTTAELQFAKLLQASANELNSQFDLLNRGREWPVTVKHLKHKFRASRKSQGQLIITLELAQQSDRPEWISFTGWADTKVFTASRCHLENYNAESILSICGHFVADLRKFK